jgi:toxin ParE1/3/4
MSSYLISLSASRDLNAIAEYFLTRNVDAGEKLFQEFVKKCQYIAQFPNLGKSYSYLRPFMRGLPLDGYTAVFKFMRYTQKPGFFKKPGFFAPRDVLHIPAICCIIFYRVVDDGIEIVRVVSGRQDLESLFSNSDDD